MEPISILALEETPKVGSKTIAKVISITSTLEPSSPSDLIEILKKANAKFKKVSVPDTQAAMIGWSKANKIWDVSQQHNIQIFSRERERVRTIQKDFYRFLILPCYYRF